MYHDAVGGVHEESVLLAQLVVHGFEQRHVSIGRNAKVAHFFPSFLHPQSHFLQKLKKNPSIKFKKNDPYK